MKKVIFAVIFAVMSWLMVEGWLFYFLLENGVNPLVLDNFPVRLIVFGVIASIYYISLSHAERLIASLK